MHFENVRINLPGKDFIKFLLDRLQGPKGKAGIPGGPGKSGLPGLPGIDVRVQNPQVLQKYQPYTRKL